jgi:hypothetical protein
MIPSMNRSKGSFPELRNHAHKRKSNTVKLMQQSSKDKWSELVLNENHALEMVEKSFK